jgi:glycosyltransferase involved in cell wall biosynthesis
VLLSVCIPAYNRASLLPALLDSILSQAFADYEVLICEDGSPQREEIRAVAERYGRLHPGRIRYLENESNLGYDGNLRRLIERAEGEFCMFMGNDDLMCPDALRTVAEAAQRHSNVGVLVRSYQSFDVEPANIVQTFRYFPDERFFPAGTDSIVTVYRRAVVIPGMVVRRAAARRFATDEFDGTLLYQLHVIANILVDMDAVFLPQVLVLYRNGGVPDFGNSPAEQGKFVPRDQTIDSSLAFMRGMLHIARAVEARRGVAIVRRIVADIANYSYPVLAIQRHRSLTAFVGYWRALGRLGLRRHAMFHLYFGGLLLLGTARCDALIGWVKRRLGYTPALGSIFRGHQA